MFFRPITHLEEPLLLLLGGHTHAVIHRAVLLGLFLRRIFFPGHHIFLSRVVSLNL